MTGSDWSFRAFSRPEHEARVARAQSLMNQQSLTACVCTSPELIYYFTGYEAHTHHAIGSQALVLRAGEEVPQLILRDGDMPQADETLTLGRTRPFRLGAEDLSSIVVEQLGKLPRNARIGLDLSGPTMSGALSQALATALAPSRITDCWRLLGRLRTVLSPAEIDYMREAATYANAGIDALFSKPTVGMSEIELAAEIEYAMRSAGSDYPAVPTWMASGPRNHCQHAMASSYRFQQGDLIHSEFAGVARRYHVVTMGSLVLGAPDPRMLEMAEAAQIAFQAGLNAAQIGRRIGDMEAEYRRALSELGMSDCCPMRFGTGLSAAYPPVWENQITVQYECDDLLEEGMAFYIHSSMQSLNDKYGMLMGGSYLMVGDGPERLDKAPIELGNLAAE